MLAAQAVLSLMLIADVPLVGRPADLPFSEASARFAVAGGERVSPFVVEAKVNVRDVEELAPVLLTLTVRAVGPVLSPPARLDLKQVAAIDRDFYVEDTTETTADTTWQWEYRLRPRSAAVAAVPGVPFVFYNPDLQPPEKAFQVIWTDPLPLSVARAEQNLRPVDVPEAVLTLNTGPAALAAGRTEVRPGVGLGLLSLLTPPAGCAAWLWWWRRAYPDMAKLQRERRSRAARRALAVLDQAAGAKGRRGAEDIAHAVGEYLRERYGLPVAEPTPAEAIAWVRGHGLGGETLDALGRILTDCTSTRFQADEALRDSLVGDARGWILALEEGPWPSS